jgi:hypothetical protein
VTPDILIAVVFGAASALVVNFLIYLIAYVKGWWP